MNHGRPVHDHLAKGVVHAIQRKLGRVHGAPFLSNGQTAGISDDVEHLGRRISTGATVPGAAQVSVPVAVLGRIYSRVGRTGRAIGRGADSVPIHGESVARARAFQRGRVAGQMSLRVAGVVQRGTCSSVVEPLHRDGDEERDEENCTGDVVHFGLEIRLDYVVKNFANYIKPAIS